MTDASGDRPLSWNVAGLLADGVGTARTYDVRDVTIDLPEDLELAAPIEGQVRLSRTNRGILVVNSLKLEVLRDRRSAQA